MSTISGIGSIDTSAYSTEYTKTTQSSGSTQQSTAVEEQAAAVYEKSDSSVTSSTAKTYTPNSALVAQLKADQQTQEDNLRSIVEQMISGQGNALAQSDDIWSFLAKGDYTVSEAAKVQAQKDLEEGGYWSVDETAGRIIDFAKALTGGDPDQIETMRNAFEEGFKQATSAWGQDLPSISSETYDAVMKGFDDWANETDSETTAAAETGSTQS